jgi:predicted GH43/DUF377 family glycosyl hydrolase
MFPNSSSPSAIVRVPYIIDLPHEGFNPSIIRWRGRLLIAWRKGWFSARMWIGELSEDHRLLWGREMDFSRFWRLTEDDWLEDPRLVVAGEKVLVVFTYVKRPDIFMALATLDDALEVGDCRIFDTAHRTWEKNWQFFEHDRVLRAIYYPNPHTVGWKAGDEFRMPAADGARLPWAWGEVRGGTPPVRVGDEYFSFFHSSLHCHYVAGFYAFEAKPPFRVTRWPKEPCLIAAKDQWRGGHAVVFPGGAILENGKWMVAFGWQDAFCCLTWFDHEKLLATLETRNLPPAQVTLPGQHRYYKPFSMEPPRSAEPGPAPRVKLVTAFIDLNRFEQRPPGKDAASYLRHARHLFAANTPLVVWLDCDEALSAQIAAAAAPYPNVTVKTFHAEDTETWRAVAGAGPLQLPQQRDPVKDTVGYFSAILMKSELVARSICEGDIPGDMSAGWLDCGIAHMPGMDEALVKWLPETVGVLSEKIRIAGIRDPECGTGRDYMTRVHWNFCGSLFIGPQMSMLKFAGAVLRELRRLLSRGEITWEVNLWALIYARHPHWFSWYQAGFDERILRNCPVKEVADEMRGKS